MRLDPAIRAVAALCLACCLRLAHGGPLWPLPLNVSDTGRLLRVHPRLRFAATGARSTLLDDAFARRGPCPPSSFPQHARRNASSFGTSTAT
jgi:hypothetical protein